MLLQGVQGELAVSHAICRLCDAELPNEELLAHLAEKHGLVGIRSWPDGEPMVLDETIEPEDF